jgi:hypothetical protein
MNKIILTTLLASVLGACGSTQPEFTAEKDVNFKPNLADHSIAYNIAMSAGAPDILKDAEVPEDAYNEISNTSHAGSMVAVFLAGGFGSASSFGLDSLSMNKANGFDRPLLTMWVEVDSFDDYGSDDFEVMMYHKARRAYESVYLGNDTITKEIGNKDESSYGVYHQGESCSNIQSANLVDDKFEVGMPCYLLEKVKIIRPVPVGSWLPEMLKLDVTKHHVIVNFELVNNVAFNAHTRFSNALLFEPSKWILKYKVDGKWKGLQQGVGMPVYKDKDNVYTFIKPKK